MASDDKTYKTKIGMEIHIQPKTKRKMFCSCPNEFNIEEPNKNICEICTGQPGTLPAANEKAIEAIIKAGIALNCKINRKVHWDRKHYFYPDLPKGFQLTQNETPFCVKGYLEFNYEDAKGKKQRKKVEINRLHLEEDAGKDLHPAGTDYSLIDYNRAGTPLIELVTEPVLEDAEQTVAFCKALQRIFRYLSVSDADMEKGQMRCEVNISLSGQGKQGSKVEVKNINSFKGVNKSIAYEIKRQGELLDEGEEVKQETRGWDADKEITVSQRGKEEAHDYRYFPEPDIPSVIVTDGLMQKIINSIGELPDQRKERFIDEHKLSEESAEILVADKEKAEFFDNVCSEIRGWLKGQTELGEDDSFKIIKLASNYIITELSKLAVKERVGFDKLKITPENFAELMVIVYKGEVNSSAAQTVLKEMFISGGDPSQIIEDKNLKVEKDEGVINGLVDEVISANPGAVADFKAGKEQALQFLMGAVMAKAKGKADPKSAMDLIKEKLK